MRISDWSSDVCSSDLILGFALCTYAPILASKLKSRNADNVVEVDLETELANVELEQPEELPPPPPDIPPPPPAVKEVNFTPPEVVPPEEVKETDIPHPAKTIAADVLLSDERSDERRVGGECVGRC